MTESLKVGIVGHGFATATFHAPLITSVPGLELTAISSSDPAKVRAAWPQVDVCDSPQALFARPDIGLVVIPTPNESHHPLALAALAAGKHVVVDKPFTIDANEARSLIDRAAEAGRFLSVFHNRRWDGDFLALRRVVESGRLGRLAHFESHFDRFRPEVRVRWRESGGPGSGLWYDLGSHLLDQTLHLFGPPRTLWLDLARQRDHTLSDDWFHAVLRYDALRVVLHASALVARPGPRFALHGTKGSYCVFGLDPQEDALRAGHRPGRAGWQLAAQPGWLTLETEEPHDAAPGDYTRYYAGVRDAILHGAPNPVPAGDALQVMRLIELGLRSAESGAVVAVGDLAAS